MSAAAISVCCAAVPPGGQQILLEDPSGNLIEQFQPAAGSRRSRSGVLRGVSVVA
jgi:hypothetical protein